MDFKAQLVEDMKVFHNVGEFAEITEVWYGGEQYTVPLILDHEKANQRNGQADHAEGINVVDAIAYIAHADLGFVPSRGRQIELSDAGGFTQYTILKSDYEDGEIILSLQEFEE